MNTLALHHTSFCRGQYLVADVGGVDHLSEDMDTGLHFLELSDLSVQQPEHVTGQAVDLIGHAG